MDTFICVKYIVNRYLLSNNYKNKDLKKGWEFALKACLNGFDYACGVGFNELKMSEKEMEQLELCIYPLQQCFVRIMIDVIRSPCIISVV